jgi:hypothetical protein
MGDIQMGFRLKKKNDFAIISGHLNGVAIQCSAGDVRRLYQVARLDLRTPGSSGFADALGVNMRSVSFAVATFLVFRTAFAAVTAHYTFNDAGSGGINLLKASVGQDAIVKTGKNPVVDVAGTGELYATNGPRRADGTGAVAIPKGQFLAIPHGLARSPGQTWFMRMRVFMPREEMHAVFSFEQDNNSDAFLFQKNKASAGGSLG